MAHANSWRSTVEVLLGSLPALNGWKDKIQLSSASIPGGFPNIKEVIIAGGGNFYPLLTGRSEYCGTYIGHRNVSFLQWDFDRSSIRKVLQILKHPHQKRVVLSFAAVRQIGPQDALEISFLVRWRLLVCHFARFVALKYQKRMAPNH